MIDDSGSMNGFVASEIRPARPGAMDGFGPSEWRAAMLSTVGVIEVDMPAAPTDLRDQT
jgi:hypothetical protein